MPGKNVRTTIIQLRIEEENETHLARTMHPTSKNIALDRVCAYGAATYDTRGLERYEHSLDACSESTLVIKFVYKSELPE